MRALFALQGLLQFFGVVSGLIFLCAFSHTQLESMNNPSLAQTVRDGTGRIWGNDVYNSKALYTWESGQWKKAGFQPDAAKEGIFQPVMVTRRPNGSVVCLWRSDSPSKSGPKTKPINHNLRDYKISEHQGGSSRFIAAFTTTLGWSPILFADATDLWITEGGRRIYRIGPHHPFKQVYTITPQQMIRWSDPIDWDTETNSLRAVRDGKGRLWFYSDVWSESTTSYMLRGVLLWDGQKFKAYTNFPGLPAKPSALNTLSYKDANHLWLALEGNGLYELDIRSLKARRIAEPQPKAFAYVQQVTLVGRDWYLVSGSRWGEDTHYDDSVLKSKLWRLENGRWRLLFSGLDKVSSNRWMMWPNEPRPILSNSQGLLVGTFGKGAWLIRPEHKQGRPSHLSGAGEKRTAVSVADASNSYAIALDWQRGLQLPSVRSFYDVGNGRLLLHGATSSALIRDLPALFPRQDSPRVKTFGTYLNLIQDSRGHLWGALSSQGQALNEWNGERWLSHPVPRNYNMDSAGECALDRKGRVWILPGDKDGTTAIYDPARKSWHLFANYRLALQAQMSKVGGKILPTAHPEFDRVQSGWQRKPYQAPDFRSDGRIAYRGGAAKLWYFDGKTWRSWTRQQIAKEPETAGRYFDWAPFFDRSGRLSVNILQKTWKWASPAIQGGKPQPPAWKKYPLEEDPRPAALQIDPTDLQPPPGTTFMNDMEDTGTLRADSLIRDAKGFFWLIAERQLHKAKPGMQAVQFSPQENHPFLDGRSFGQVLVDNKGNTFFKTDSDSAEYVLLPRSALPDTAVKVTANAVDSFTFDFSMIPANAKGVNVRKANEKGATRKQDSHRWFQWRLDNGNWSAPRTDARVRLDHLPGGRRKFTVMAIDKSLQGDPTPAVASFLVDIDPAKQVTAYIAALASPDYARREAAVAGLARQPFRALPALRAARPRATSSTQWWIDAAIQQAEEAARNERVTDKIKATVK